MRLNRIFIYIVAGALLSGCAQSTAMLGPAITLASTGNASQAGIAFFTNKAVKKETGMDTVSFVSQKIEGKNSINRQRREFKNLVENNFEKTRQKLILQDQTNTFN